MWLSAPVSWDNVSLPGLRVLHLRGEKNGDITPLLSSITYLHLEEMRKTEDLAPFLTAAPRLQKLYLQSLPVVQVLPELDGLPALYALKLYELHKLSDLSALSLSHLRYFAASLIGDQLSAQALADAVMTIPNLEAAALQLVDRSERRYGSIQKCLCCRWEIRIAAGGNQCFEYMAVAVTQCKGGDQGCVRMRKFFVLTV